MLRLNVIGSKAHQNPDPESATLKMLNRCPVSCCQNKRCTCSMLFVMHSDVTRPAEPVSNQKVRLCGTMDSALDFEERTGEGIQR